jgi:hypothetical protein
MQFPAVMQWMDLLATYSTKARASSSKVSAHQALAIAQANEPAAITEPFTDYHGIAQGSPVTITAESFGPEATEGLLVGATPTQLTLARSSEATGLVHVHFPRIGFVLKAVKP